MSTTGAKLPPAGAKDVLYIVDLPNYVFRAYHAISPLSSSKGEPTHAIHGTVNMILKIVNERKPEMFAVALDTLAPNFRKSIDKEYKAHRPPAPPDLGKQMGWCEKIVEAFNIPIYRTDGLEADDVIAALVARADREKVRVVIVSIDKDMMQVVHDDDEDVVLWDTMRNIVYGPAQVKEKLGVKPSQVRDFLALCGDTSDNVPGVPGVGLKTAADLLNQFGSIDELYAHLPEIKREKLRENLVQHEADARLSQRLVTLARDADVAWDREHLRYGNMHVPELRRLFTELELTRPLSLLPPPPPVVRTYELAARREALEVVAKNALERGRLAIEVLGSSDDPMRSDVIGVALSTKPGEGIYAPIGHRSLLTVSGQVSMRDVRDVIGPVLRDERVRKVGCDLKRVEVIFAEREMPLAEPTWDVAIASYLLDPEAKFTIEEIARRELDETLPKLPDKVADLEALETEKTRDVAGAHVEAIASLGEKLAARVSAEKLERLMKLELELARVLARMEMFGVLVDTEVLQRLSREADLELKKLEDRAKEVAGREFAIRSRDQLETILFDDLKLPVRKRTPKGGRSTDAEVLEELDHPLTRVILLHREVDKLKGTYLDALPRYVNPKTGRIHTRFAQTVAATGRLSSLDPNLQNIPVRTELGRAVRQAFVAPEGSVLVSADYSQIELRILAHLSKDPVLLETYRKGEDVHARTASVIFDLPLDQVSSDQRRAAKTINFGVMYGMGEPALARQLSIPREQAARFIESYFRRYEGVARFMQQTIEHARAGNPVLTMLGRRRFLPNLRSMNRGLRLEAERIAKNTPIQGTAADILKLAMVELGEGEVAPGATMVLTVHDELLFEVPKSHAKLAMERIKIGMEDVIDLDVPLVVDIGAGPNWASAK